MASSKKQNSPVLHIAASTLTAELVTLPICTLKTLVQVNHMPIWSTYTTLVKQHGHGALLRASVPATVAQVITTTCKVSLYRKFQSSGLPNVANGILAGIIGSAMSHPFDVIKVHMQQHQLFIPSLIQKGPKLLYRGYGTGLMKTIVGGATYLPIYDYSREHISNHWAAGAVAAFTSATLIHPLDYIKLRVMAGQHMGPLSKMYTGWTLHVLRVVPHFAITMGMIETLGKLRR